jgi:hypothetical protein
LAGKSNEEVEGFAKGEEIVVAGDDDFGSG